MAWTTSADPRGIILSALRGTKNERADTAVTNDADRWPSNRQFIHTRPTFLEITPDLFAGPFAGLLGIHAIAVIAAIAAVETLWPVIALAATSTALMLHVFSRHSTQSSREDSDFNEANTQAQANNAPARTSDPLEQQYVHTASFSRVEGLSDEPGNWSELMQRVSHELRTPLNAVIGFSDLMHNETFGPLGSPRYQEYARFIRDSGDALLKSTEDTLAMTSALTAAKNRQAADPSAQPLASAINAAWSRISQRPENAGLELALSCDQDIEVLIDSRPLRQILINLMSEAAARMRDTDASQRTAMSIKVGVDHDLVQIEFATPAGSITRDGNSLDLCVARALLELQGTSLLLIDNPAVGWRAITVLDRAAQTDFFSGDTTLTNARNLKRPADTVRNVA